jgi:hypothetical protein
MITDSGRPARAAAPFGIDGVVEVAAVGHAGQAVGHAQFAHGVGLALDGQLAAHARAHHGHIERLADEVHRAGFQRARFIFGLAQRGDENHGNVLQARRARSAATTA